MDPRKPNGQFMPGHKGGPGRPPLAQELAYADAFREALSPDTLKKVIGVLVKSALAGSVRSADILLKHAIRSSDTYKLAESEIEPKTLADFLRRWSDVQKASTDNDKNL